MSLFNVNVLAARTAFALFAAVCGFETAASAVSCNGRGGVATPGCLLLDTPKQSADGDYLFGPVTLAANGTLYGTSHEGGVGGSGTVFELTPSGAHKVIYSFGSIGSDGENPQGPLVLDQSGVLYGTTPAGAGGYGEVFELAPPTLPGGAWKYTIIYAFQGGADGAQPWYAGVVIGKHGILYGTTAYGGNSANCGNSIGCGTVFRLTPPVSPSITWTESVLHRFTGGSDGGAPQASLLINNGALFGTTFTGGTQACSQGNGGCGVVFELKPLAGGRWRESTLYRFAGGDDGGNSSAPLITRAGALYGTTSQGGPDAGNCSWGCGSVFELAPPASPGGAWTETVLHHFQVPNDKSCIGQTCDASDPLGGVVFGLHGALYGASYLGGPFGAFGAIFQLLPPAAPGAPWTESVLYGAHSGESFPSSPVAGLTAGKRGAIYGTTVSGGGGHGMVFELKP